MSQYRPNSEQLKIIHSPYLAMSIFVATIAAIGIVVVFVAPLTWIPLLFTFVGTGLLFYGCVLLILKSRLALFTTYHEMDFLWRMGKQYPPELLAKCFRNT